MSLQPYEQEALEHLLSQALRGENEEALCTLRRCPKVINVAWCWEEFVVDGKWVWQGTTALMAACKGGHIGLVKELLKLGADMNARGEGGWDALMCAARFGHIATISLLLGRGADPNTRCNTEGWTALVLAAYRDHIEACILLLSRGADLMAVVDGRTVMDLYGEWVKITPELKTVRRAALEAAWRAGPHPSQVQRRKDEAWERRWPFVQITVCHDFHPLTSRRLFLATMFPPLPPNVPIPSLSNKTKAERVALLRDKIFTHVGLWQLIISFI